MGSSNDTAVGAYLEIKGTYIRQVINYLCENKHENRYDDEGKFCSECGTKISKVVIDELSKMTDIYDFFDEEDEERFTDVLQCPEYCKSPTKNTFIAFGNMCDDTIDLNDEAKEITHDMIQLYIDEFKKDYAEILAYMDAKENVEYTIKFGAFNYSY